MKRFIDVFGAIVMIFLLSPLMALIAIAIKLESTGKILFRQNRLGENGVVFQMLKFRSMVSGAEFMEQGLFNYENDPRVTKVGNILRVTSLDELPQLFNILGGDMSFVGPRPPVEYELGEYDNLDAHFKERFVVKPGVTGLAQINGRNQNSWDEKIRYDLEYVDRYKKWGVLLDMKILLITVFKVIRMEGKYESRENSESDKQKML